jgi:UDP-N-acetylglucosamine--N-acetylmuramyl-(pentapeptide) pyrophosphoryl-undecaprenol N-acetylglucosamine transferase
LKSVIIAAGGTGGHISPGVALAEALLDKKTKYEIESVYIHSLERNKENPDLQDSPCPVLWHNSPTLSYKTIVFFPFLFLWNFLLTVIQFRKLKVDHIISMGGYSCLPAILYGIMFRKKIFLCEQNRIAGKVNRIFMKYASKLALSFPLLDSSILTITYRVLGNPLRKKIIPNETATPKWSKKVEPDTKLNVLVLGGSQGARQINRMVMGLMESQDIKDNFVFRLLTGTNLYAETIEKLKSTTNIYSYSNDMKVHYEWSDLVIARSGAGVLFECMAYRLPMVLIPYPYATDNHQQANALYCEEHCGSYVISQKDEDSSALLAVLNRLLSDKNSLREISNRTFQNAKVDAAANTIQFFFEGE